MNSLNYSFEQSLNHVNSIVKFIGNNHEMGPTAATSDILGSVLFLLILIFTGAFFYVYKINKKSAKFSSSVYSINTKSVTSNKIMLAIMSVLLICTLAGAFIVFIYSSCNAKADAETVSAINIQSAIEANVNEDGSISIPNIPIKNTNSQKNVTLQSITLTSKSNPSVAGTNWTFSTTYEGKTHETKIIADSKEYSFGEFLFKPNEEYIFTLSASEIDTNTAKSLIGQDVLNINIAYTTQEPPPPESMHSEVKDYNGIPTLYVNDKPFPTTAYMTYLEKHNNYSEFASCGYDLYSLPVLFAGRWISITKGLTPWNPGIFDSKDGPDFSTLDNSVKMILDKNPKALIFPRVNVSMPKWWTDENPDECCGIPDRESFYSEKWYKQVEENLRVFVDYVHHSEYANHIVGYQIAGGQTEEWFHFDMNAGYAKAAEEPFKNFLKEHYPDTEYKGLPDMDGLKKKATYHGDDYLAKFIEFSCLTIANRISSLAKVVKDVSEHKVVVGAFYGYSLEVNTSGHGIHALNTLLQSPDIDFICSPNSYIGIRNMNYDWTEMYPADTVRLHGKLCMQECDIRTYCTKLLHDSDPSIDPDNIMNGDIWKPLKSIEDSVAMIKKSFSRQLIKGNGFWWFDMWGGWYNNTTLLNYMTKFKDLVNENLNNKNRGSIAQCAIFIDEDAYKDYGDSPMRSAVHTERIELGNIGAPYDIYDIHDFESVYKKYKACIFISCKDRGQQSKCEQSGIKYISNSESEPIITSDKLREGLNEAGVHIYSNSNDIIYINKNYIAIHANTGGTKTLNFESNCKLIELLENDQQEFSGKSISIDMKNNETKLFKILNTEN